MNSNETDLERSLHFTQNRTALSAKGAAVPQGERISLSNIGRTIQRHQMLMIGIFFFFTALAALYCLVAHRKYDAVGLIEINFDETNALGIGGPLGSIGGIDDSAKLETQVNVLSSQQLIWKVITDLQLDKRDQFLRGFRKLHPAISYQDPDPGARALLIDTFTQNLTVQTVPQTLIIKVRYRSTDPRLAAEIVNKLIDDYKEQSFQSRYEATMQASDWLASQLDNLKQQVEDSQRKLADYQQEHGILGGFGSTQSGAEGESPLPSVHNNVLDQMDAVNRDLVSATVDRMAKESLYRQAQGGEPELVANSRSPLLEGMGMSQEGSIISQLRGRRSGLESQMAQLTATYGPNFPQVLQTRSQIQELDAEIAQEDKNIVQSLRKSFESASQTEGMLRTHLEQLTNDAFKLNQAAVKFAIMKQEVASNRNLYTTLLAKVKEAGVTAGLRATNISIIDRASIPIRPSAPNVPLYIMIAMVTGFFVGLCVAMFLDNRDHSIGLPEDVEKVLSAPLLGVIPHVQPTTDALPRLGMASQITILTAPGSQAAEAYRSLRTALLLSSPEPPKTILFTSALPSEGKTSIALNCAAALASMDSRVILVEADLRRPRLAIPGVPRDKVGLSEVITGMTTTERCVKHIPELPTLDILPAGPVSPRPAELLGSDRMRQLIEDWKDRYDHIVIDSPPVLAVTDPVILAHRADAVILIARSQQTSWRSFRRTGEILSRARIEISGLVVNDFHPNSLAYYEYYGYSGKKYDQYYTSELPSKEST